MYNHKYHQQDISNTTFLITGGAGFIGSNLGAYLMNYGAAKVRVIDNLSTGYIENIQPFLNHPSFEFIEGDICDKSICDKVMEGIDFVSHQAALGSVPRSVKDPITSAQSNIMGFLNVLVSAKEAGVKQLVYAASSSTYGDSKTLPKVEDKIGKPLSPYAVTKYANELFAEVFADIYGMRLIGLRYFNVFGPKQNKFGPYAAVIPLFISSSIEGVAPTINGDGTQSRDFTFIENVLQANMLALQTQTEKKHEVFNVAFGSKTSLNELWENICSISGKNFEAIHGPDRMGDIRDSLADISKAESMLGYKPLYDVKKGLEITFEWYKEYYAKN